MKTMNGGLCQGKQGLLRKGKPPFRVVRTEKVLPKNRIEQITEICMNLERLEDVGELVKLTVPR